SVALVAHGRNKQVRLLYTAGKARVLSIYTAKRRTSDDFADRPLRGPWAREGRMSDTSDLDGGIGDDRRQCLLLQPGKIDPRHPCRPIGMASRIDARHKVLIPQKHDDRHETGSERNIDQRQHADDDIGFAGPPRVCDELVEQVEKLEQQYRQADDQADIERGLQPRLLKITSSSPCSARLRAERLDPYPVIVLGCDYVVTTHLPAAIRTRDADNVYGDSNYDMILSDWKDVAGAKRAHTLSFQLNGMEVQRLTLKEVTVNAPIPPNTFAVNDEVKAKAKT